ncbi:MAG: HlyD family efflux transporter periplasmic adaptor subunit [Odoribacter sp.]|nr:HlyD family efflux transporter periplasmic adaptor subunit [Odoribacter sp.]
MAPQRSRIDRDLIETAEVVNGIFLEYVDVEGIVYPFKTVKVNALEAGFVDKVIAEDGAILNEGDTILLLKNPELMRAISDEEDEYQRQQRLLKEQEIEISQKSLTLQLQTLDVDFEMNQLEDKRRIAHEEFDMGMISRAELDLAEREYNYHRNKTELQRRNLIHDSTSTTLRWELLQVDLGRVRTRRDRVLARKENLIVRAPISGQLSFLTVSTGEQVQSGASVGEIKMMNNFKLHARLNEYYVDRISAGLQGSITSQGEQFPLQVSRVVPEIRDRNFEVDLVFTGRQPKNLRVGKSYRVQIELGQSEQAVIIPNGDFYTATNGKWIYKIIDGVKAVKTSIVIGRKNPTQYEVLAGLKPGDQIIVNGYEQFNNKDEIILQ